MVNYQTSEIYLLILYTSIIKRENLRVLEYSSKKRFQ